MSVRMSINLDQSPAQEVVHKLARIQIGYSKSNGLRKPLVLEKAGASAIV